jgi:flagellin
MAFSTGGRINTNISAQQAYSALNAISREHGVHQLRLATGKRINSASDDPSGYVISKKMEARMRAMSSAVDNVGDAQSVYGVAEGGYQTIADILVSIKEKQARAANGAMGDNELNAIASEINSLAAEIDDIVTSIKFNGVSLFSVDASGNKYDVVFQVGESLTETLSVAFSADVSSAALFSAVATAGAIVSSDIAGLDVDSAINTVNVEIGKIGANVNRLTIKESNLTTAITNTEAAKSRIMDADVAKEQIQVSKLQILQQTSTAQLAQANSAPQNFLSLFK